MPIALRVQNAVVTATSAQVTKRKAAPLSPVPNSPKDIESKVVEPKIVELHPAPATADLANAVESPAETQQEASNAADTLLIQKAQAGDHRAFGVLVAKYQRRVIHAAARIVGETEAMDVAQDSFVKAWRSINSFRGDSAFYTWLFRITINTAKNVLASRSRRSAFGELELDDAEAQGHLAQFSELATPERLRLTEELRDKIFGTIDKLPKALRNAIVLREIDGLSYEAIAEIECCPVGTVRSRIHRARQTIDRVVDPLMQH